MVQLPLYMVLALKSEGLIYLSTDAGTSYRSFDLGMPPGEPLTLAAHTNIGGLHLRICN